LRHQDNHEQAVSKMITLYGTPTTRTRRNLWLLEELGVAYQLERVAPREPSSQTPAYRALNPMSKVPTLVDGDFTLTESMAINLYLARRHGAGTWWPATIEGEARLLKWTFFAATELDPHFFTMIFERLLKAEGQRIPGATEQAEQMIARALRMLEDHLSTSEFLLGDSFTLSDLNVSGTCTMGRRVSFDFSPYPQVSEWLGRCWARPAFARVDALT
jgi:glutathione S-transferase